MAKLKTFSLYETTETNSNELLDAFKAATKHRITNTGSTAKKGMETKWATPLKNILKEAKDYTDKSGKYWHKCHQLKDELDGYVEAIRTEIDVDNFERELAQKKGKSMESLRRLSERIKRYLPEGKGQKVLDKINGPSGVEKILAFSQKYNLIELIKHLHTDQTKEKIDISGGGKVAQPEIEAKFPLKTLKHLIAKLKSLYLLLNMVLFLLVLK